MDLFSEPYLSSAMARKHAMKWNDLNLNQGYFNGGVSRMGPKIGTAVCGNACTVV